MNRNDEYSEGIERLAYLYGAFVCVLVLVVLLTIPRMEARAKADYAIFVRVSGRPDVTFDEWQRLSSVECAAPIGGANVGASEPLNPPHE